MALSLTIKELCLTLFLPRFETYVDYGGGGSTPPPFSCRYKDFWTWCPTEWTLRNVNWHFTSKWQKKEKFSTFLSKMDSLLFSSKVQKNRHSKIIFLKTSILGQFSDTYPKLRHPTAQAKRGIKNLFNKKCPQLPYRKSHKISVCCIEPFFSNTE